MGPEFGTSSSPGIGRQENLAGGSTGPSPVHQAAPTVVVDPAPSQTPIDSVESLTIEGTSWRGPMPPPEAVLAYKEIDPTWPDRLLAMAESAQKHGQEMELARLKASIDDRRGMRIERRIGQLGAVWIATACLAVALVAALYGHDVVAGTIGSTTVVGLTTVFITGRKMKNESAPTKPGP